MASDPFVPSDSDDDLRLGGGVPTAKKSAASVAMSLVSTSGPASAQMDVALVALSPAGSAGAASAQKDVAADVVKAEIEGIEQDIKVKAGGPPAQKRRMLKRHRSEGKPGEVTCSTMLALHGKPLKTPVLVHPLQTIEGRKYFSVSEHLPWLRRAMCPKGETHYTSAMQNAVTELRTALRKQVEVAMSPVDQLRRSLDLEEPLSPVAEHGQSGSLHESPASAKKPKRSALAREATVKVELDGVKFDMKGSLRPLLVVACPESVLAVVKFCQRHFKAGRSLQQKAVVVSPRGFSLPDDGCQAILGKVTWQPSLMAWAVHWKDDRGKPGAVVRFAATQGGAKKAKATRLGQGDMSGSSVVKRRPSYLQAIAKWNELDQSSRERIPMPQPLQ